MTRTLLVEPGFPIPAKSRNHKNFLPTGLLKIASYLRKNGVDVKLVRGISQDLEDLARIVDFGPAEVWITSLFTYWAGFVRETVQHYKGLFPGAKVVVGGIYASLLPKDEVKEYTGCDEVYQGIIPEAEECFPAYDLVNGANPHQIDYQILHASRGCPRQCAFCGTWKIEPEFVPLRSIKGKVRYRKLVFYDNNFLMNPFSEDILEELIELRSQGKIAWCESQSGFDGRILLQQPHLALMIKRAGFRYPRIAWDWKYDDYPKIERQIDLLTNAGYHRRDIYVFVLYNWDIFFEVMEMKRVKCWDWRVQIADCRYRPLNQLYDNYKPWLVEQTSRDYYIHEKAGWTDALIKQFRRNVRQQNICARHGFPFYSRTFENKELGRDIRRKVKAASGIREKTRLLKSVGADYWIPDETRHPSGRSSDDQGEQQVHAD